ncbi:MAG: lysine--tRNA ligase [Bacteroidetes bacterium]|nr:lysine--tRNA ligase [Bacteroidota bacterium]
MINNLSEQELLRRKKKEQIEELGTNPYPSESFESNITIKEILQKFDKKEAGNFKDIKLAGRLMSRRIMGSASFAEIMDDSDRIQLYIHRDSICPNEDKTLYNTVFKKLMDIGDIIGIKGYIFVTKVGETSIHVQELKLLSKSLKPLPIVKEAKEGDEKKVYDAFTDPEHRYRQRYIDLLVNPYVKQIFKKRTKVIKVLRDYFDDLGCLEVETPTLQPIYGGALARPFTTFHNTLDMDFYLRISNELYLKRLIVGGFKGVYEFAKLFRNEGMSRFHNPEFTSVEAYFAYKDYFWLMDQVESVIEEIAIQTNGTSKIQIGDNKIEFKKPWKRYTMFEVIQKFTDIDISEMNETELKKVAKDLKIKVDDSMGKGKIIDEIFGEKCEPKLIQPTIIMDYPIEMSPLAKNHRSKPGLVERFEVICNGKEICNAYSELNDPIEQRKRFENQLELGKRGDDETMALDEDYLRALEYGMPPTAGIGIGIDRLVMLMTNASSIQEVIFFPHMKPENQN